MSTDIICVTVNTLSTLISLGLIGTGIFFQDMETIANGCMCMVLSMAAWITYFTVCKIWWEGKQ